METKNPINQNVDKRILKLLNLSDVFDLDEEEYTVLLREKLIEITSTSKKKVSDSDFNLLKSEIQKVRQKKFKPKRKIDSKNISNLNISKQKLLPGTAQKKETTKKLPYGESLIDIARSINKILGKIYNNLLDENKLQKKEFQSDRKKKEDLKRKEKEDTLEKKDGGIIETAKKLFTPIESIFDKIKRFLLFTILGRAFKVFMDWAGDPKNKQKVNTIAKFIKDFWPVLLGAWLLFANPLGKFVRAIIGTVAKLSLRLAKFAIPKLAKFIAANPKAVAAAAVVGGGAYLATKLTGQQEAAPIQAQNKAKVQTGKTTEVRGTDTAIDKSSSVGDMGPTTPYGLLQGVASGGKIFDGIVDKNTGTTVSGAGPDTQFLPIAEGGGAVLQKGETVLQKGARERMIKDQGIDPLAYNVGPNANKSRKINSSNIFASANGGLISAFNKGGVVGKEKNPIINASDYSSLLAISALEADKPQGRADVAQSLYNRILAANKYGANFNQSSNTLKGLITSPQQYEPTFKNVKDWLNIKDKKTAAIAVMNSEKGKRYKWNMADAMNQLNATEAALKNPILQENAKKHVGGRAYFLGTSQQSNMNTGDVVRNKQSNFFSPWYLEGSKYDKERRNIAAPLPQMLAPKTSDVRPKQPSIIDRLAGLLNAGKSATAKPVKKKDGGVIVGENDGLNIRGATDDRQLFSTLGGGTAALHPGEGIVPRDVIQNIGVDGFNRFIAAFESGRNSNAAKLGYTKPIMKSIEPPSSSSGGNIITLPPMVKNSVEKIKTGSSSKPQIPGFSIIPSSSVAVRQNNAAIYGIIS